jgi:hypothetical protein
MHLKHVGYINPLNNLELQQDRSSVLEKPMLVPDTTKPVSIFVIFRSIK